MSDIKVTKNDYTVEPLHQWDVNQQLQIYGLSLASVPEVHFSNQAMDKAIVRQASMDKAGVITVDVPNGLLQKYYTINVYICTYDGGTFQTLYKIDVPVMERPKPADYSIEADQDVYSFKALENQVANVLNKFDEVDKRYNASVANYNAAATAYNNAEKSLEKIQQADEIVRTSYTRDEILDADTKAALGLPADAVPKDAFNALTKVQHFTYVGTDTYGQTKANHVTLDFEPKVLMIMGNNNQVFAVYGGTTAVVVRGTGGASPMYFSWDGVDVSWYNKESAAYQLNKAGETYYGVALG